MIHFAHANGIPSPTYQPLFDRLAPHSVIALRQFGHNPKFPYSNNWTYLADELVDFLQQNTSEPVVAVGHSLGALVSFIAACKYPDKFKGVLLLDPPLLFGTHARVLRLAKFFRQSDLITPAGKSKTRKFKWNSRDEAKQYFASKRLFQFEPACFDAFCNTAVEDRPDGSVELTYKVDVEVGVFRNVPHNLSRYNLDPGMPAKVMYANRSDASLGQCIRPFCRYFGIPYEVIEGQHMYPLQQPDLTAKLIHEFLDGLG